MAARMAALFVDLEPERPLPSVERALSGPGSSTDPSWNRRVKVVTGGQGPAQRDLQTLDRDRARLPLGGPRLIVVLGCTGGAGQSTIAAMTGLMLAALRDVPVAALDLNPGGTSLATHIAPAASVTALLAGEVPEPQDHAAADARPLRGDWRVRAARRSSAARLDVIAEPGTDGRALDALDYQRLARALAERYPLTMIDPSPSRLTRALAVADQLVLVAPTSPEAATALANTQQWLGTHGYAEVAARAVTVINGVGRRASEDGLRAESVARGRGRAIVRIPWDDQRPGTPDALSALDPQTRHAYTALAGVLVAGMDARTVSREGSRPGKEAR
jgi:MinD-like ATPase involved in chromosome partitioning or flagellar assembly